MKGSGEFSQFENALALMQEERYADAIEAFSAVIAQAPSLSGAYGNRGLAYLNLGMTDKAQADFASVLRIDPEDAMGYSMMADAVRFSEQPHVTLAWVVKALEHDPDDAQAHFVRGWLFARAGQWSEAAEDFSFFLEQYPDNSDLTEFCEMCRTLAADDPTDEDGRRLDSQEKVAKYLRMHGWSFEYSFNPEYERDGLPCPYAHCIRNCQAAAAEADQCCPVFGYICPGGGAQVQACRGESVFFTQ